jgi:hypothetical protein
MALATARLELVMNSFQIIFCSVAQLLRRKWGGGGHQSIFRTISWSRLVRITALLVALITLPYSYRYNINRFVKAAFTGMVRRFIFHKALAFGN